MLSMAFIIWFTVIIFSFAFLVCGQRRIERIGLWSFGLASLFFFFSLWYVDINATCFIYEFFNWVLK